MATKTCTKRCRTRRKSWREAKETDLEDVKGFELNVLALVAQHVHHHLEVRLLSDITRHDTEIGTVEQYLAKKFERLPFGDVVVGKDECRKGRKELFGVNTGEHRFFGKRTLS